MPHMICVSEPVSLVERSFWNGSIADFLVFDNMNVFYLAIIYDS